MDRDVNRDSMHFVQIEDANFAILNVQNALEETTLNVSHAQMGILN